MSLLNIVSMLAVEKIDAGSVNIPTANANDVLAGILGLVYMVAGITAVLAIIIAGYMYTISDGKPDEIAKAKNTILYALIGLIFVGSAFVITQFVLGRF